MQIEKIKEIILGGALGDGFGYPIEFFSSKKIKQTFGILEDYLLHNQKIIVSDDTQMSLFALQATKEILKNNIDLKSSKVSDVFYKHFIDWYKTQTGGEAPQTELGKMKILHLRQAPGNTCLSALSSGKMGTLSRPLNDSKGCGGIMRTAPINLLSDDNDLLFHLGCQQAAITHGHIDGYVSSGLLNVILNELSLGKTFSETLQTCKNILSQNNSGTLMKVIHQLENTLNEDNTLFGDDLTRTLGEGWTGETCLALSFYCAAKAKNFKDYLILSANHSGDSDSTASVAAQIYIAKHSLPAYDYKKVEQLDVYSAIKLLFEKFKIKLDAQNNTSDVQKNSFFKLFK